MDNTSTHAFSPAEIERMRFIIGQHDAQTAGNGAKEFDLANPPVPPYRHQPYPVAMYNHKKRLIKKAETAEQQAQAEAAGWTTEAFLPDDHQVPSDVFLSDEDQAEVAAINKELKKKKGE